jgi:hypothetical protein
MTGRRELRKRLPYKLTIGKHTIHPIRELAYTEHNISQMMRRLPSMIAWWGRLKAIATKQHKNASQDVLERIEDLKAAYKVQNPRGKVTDAALFANRDKRVRLLWRRRDMLRQKRETMEACYEAAIATSRLIQSVGAMRRSELENLHDSVKE